MGKQVELLELLDWEVSLATSLTLTQYIVSGIFQVWLVLQVPEVVPDFQVFLVKRELMVLQDRRAAWDSKVKTQTQNCQVRSVRLLAQTIDE